MTNIISLIITAIFFLIVIALSFLSILGMFIVIKYGRSHVVTIVTSLIYSGFFLLVALGAYLTLQQI